MPPEVSNAPTKTAGSGQQQKLELLSDEQMLRFIINGFHVVEPDEGMYPAGFHEHIIDVMQKNPSNRGNSVLTVCPELNHVYNHPRVRGALVSLLGGDMTMDEHRHCHLTWPNHVVSQGWHQDGTNERHHQTRFLLAMYYPQDVSPAMGPTAVLPGSHLRNAPTDRMANYTNIHGTKFLTVKAGSVAIVHFDTWHAATLNRTDIGRYMFKFVFDRQSEPVAGKPSWSHDPVEGPKLAKRILRELVGPTVHYGSDNYKEWALRKEMWDWYLGQGAGKPAENAFLSFWR